MVQVETKGHLWHLRYPIEGKTFNPEDPSTFIVVATTRPETMLGDTAVAVHPDDERYKALVGKNVILPLVGRKIPIIADEYSDPEKGSGAVKITPAHDFNDFEVGKRHKLPQINMFDVEGKADSQGQRRISSRTCRSQRESRRDAEARRRSIASPRARRSSRVWKTMAWSRRSSRTAHVVPHGDRSNVVIEPFLTDQWYVNAKKLAKPAIAAVRDGKTKFVPKNWENDLFQLDGKHPALVHLAPALVGPPDSGVVWPGR